MILDRSGPRLHVWSLALMAFITSSLVLCCCCCCWCPNTPTLDYISANLKLFLFSHLVFDEFSWIFETFQTIFVPFVCVFLIWTVLLWHWVLIHFYPLGSQHIAAWVHDLFQGSLYEVLTLVSTAVLSSLSALPCLCYVPCYVPCCRFCDPNWLLQSFVSVTGDDPWQRLMVCSSRPHKLIRPTIPHNQMINPRDDDLNSFCIKCNELRCPAGLAIHFQNQLERRPTDPWERNDQS